MEVFVRTKCQFHDPEAIRWAKEMLGENPPLFDDELPEKYGPIFHAFEDCIPPENYKFSGKQNLTLEWTLSSSWAEDLTLFLTNLAQIHEVKTYTCAIADDVIIFVEGDKLSSMVDGHELASQAKIEIDNGRSWINKLLNYFAKHC